MGRIADRVPVRQAGNDHPFLIGDSAYRRIEDAINHSEASRAAFQRYADAFEAGTGWRPGQPPAGHVEARLAESRARAAAEVAAKDEALAERAAVTERKAADKAKKAQHDEALAYVADYTGTWGLPLDIRADRRWGTKYMKLSERQVEVLLAGKARDAARAEAADIARELYAAEQWEAHHARSQTPQAPELAAQQPARPAVGRVTEDGMYRTPDGTIWKVQRAVHGSGQLYAKRLEVVPGSTGTFVYEPGAIRRLTPEQRMTLDEARAFGKLYGVCCVCGRTLTDEHSIAAGIGPICAEHV